MKADTITEAAIKALVLEFMAGYARRDAHTVMALYASDPNLVVFADGHKYVGKDQVRGMIETDLRSFDSIAWQFTQLLVSSVCPVAWVVTDATATGQTGGHQVPLGAYRFTWVCEKRGDKWLIVHGHASPVADEG